MQSFSRRRMFEKSIIRKKMREMNRALPNYLRERASERIFCKITTIKEFQQAECIALFCSLKDEPNTESILKALLPNKRVVVPRVEGEIISFYDYSQTQLECGSYGILEPQNGMAVDPKEIDLVVVPGVAFTTTGKRMGRGKGYYDRYLSQLREGALKIGVCYAHQIVEELPTEPHDIMMDCVIYG